MSCEFSQESIISCSDVITLPASTQMVREDEVENLVFPCRKIFIIISGKDFLANPNESCELDGVTISVLNVSKQRSSVSSVNDENHYSIGDSIGQSLR